MRRPDLGALEEPGQPFRTPALAAMGACPVNVRLERRVGRLESIQRQGTDDVGGIDQPADRREGQRPDGGRGLSAVDQRQTLLGLENDGFEAGFGQAPARGDPPAVDDRFTLADQDQGQVRQGRKITRGADRTLAGNDRVDPVVEQIEDSVRQQRATPRVPGRQHVGPQQEHRPNDRFWKRVADAAAVGSHEIELKVGQPVIVDPNLGELAEPRIDAVHHFSRRQDLLDNRPRTDHPLPSLIFESYRRLTERHRFDIFDRQCPAIDPYGFRIVHRPSTGRSVSPGRPPVSRPAAVS